MRLHSTVNGCVFPVLRCASPVLVNYFIYSKVISKVYFVKYLGPLRSGPDKCTRCEDGYALNKRVGKCEPVLLCDQAAYFDSDDQVNGVIYAAILHRQCNNH